MFSLFKVALQLHLMFDILMLQYVYPFLLLLVGNNCYHSGFITMSPLDLPLASPWQQSHPVGWWAPTCPDYFPTQ